MVRWIPWLLAGCSIDANESEITIVSGHIEIPVEAITIVPRGMEHYPSDFPFPVPADLPILGVGAGEKPGRMWTVTVAVQDVHGHTNFATSMKEALRRKGWTKTSESHETSGDTTTFNYSAVKGNEEFWVEHRSNTVDGVGKWTWSRPLRTGEGDPAAP